jgi:hypothetical protein
LAARGWLVWDVWCFAIAAPLDGIGGAEKQIPCGNDNKKAKSNYGLKKS